MLAYLRAPLLICRMQRRFLGGAGIDDRLRQFHVVDVERADGKPAVVGEVEHRLGGHQRHGSILSSKEEKILSAGGWQCQIPEMAAMPDPKDKRQCPIPQMPNPTGGVSPLRSRSVWRREESMVALLVRCRCFPPGAEKCQFPRCESAPRRVTRVQTTPFAEEADALGAGRGGRTNNHDARFIGTCTGSSRWIIAFARSFTLPYLIAGNRFAPERLA